MSGVLLIKPTAGRCLMLPAYQAAARLQHQASKPQGGLLFIHSRGGSHPQQQTAGRVIIYRQGGEATARRAAAPGIISNQQPGGALMVPTYQAAAVPGVLPINRRGININHRGGRLVTQ